MGLSQIPEPPCFDIISGEGPMLMKLDLVTQIGFESQLISQPGLYGVLLFLGTP